MKYIQSLSKLTFADVALVGGKAASLGELIQAGVPVPDGFVVTTDGFRHGMSVELSNEILETFDKLELKRVAVRSSAVAEDSLDASWAGQLESYLNVRRDGVVKAVQDCWASIESARASSYADEHKVNKADRAVAVVVQTMVDSEISGVMFTANPITSSRDEIMIEAVYGLGEMIVQGMVTPESIVLDKTSGAVTSRSQHRQDKQLVYKDGANCETPVAAELKGKDILTSKQIAQLLKLAKQIEAHYASPQDIEWAYANSQFFVVQSRPITTLKDKPAQASDNLPFSPNSDIFRWGPIRGRYFYISDYVAACFEDLPRRYKGERFPDMLLLFNGEYMVWLSDLNRFVDQGKQVFERYVENPQTLESMKRDWQQASAELVKLQINIIPEALQKLSDKEFTALWQKFYKAMIDFWLPTLLPELGNYGAPDLLKQDLKQYITDEEELIRAQEILNAPEELSFYQQEEMQLFEATDLHAHQSKYFWLKNSYGSIEVLPLAYFEKRQAELAGTSLNLSQHQLVPATQAAKQKLQKQYRLPNRLMRRAKLISDNIVWQDHRKRVMSENFHYKKLLLEELARRTGAKFSDLLSLGFDKAIGLLAGATLNKRHTFHGVQFRDSLADLSEDQSKTYWQEYARHKASDTGLIQGIVASNGGGKTVTGKVRVLHTSHDLLEPGEILVTTMTSPGYVFAMRHAAAVITDVGGLTSHAAIVSREIGVPCIVGTKIATQILKTGDKVEVDANTGIIRLINGGE